MASPCLPSVAKTTSKPRRSSLRDRASRFSSLSSTNKIFRHVLASSCVGMVARFVGRSIDLEGMLDRSLGRRLEDTSSDSTRFATGASVATVCRTSRSNSSRL